MSLPKIIFAGTAALALSLSLGACSLTVNRAGSGDSGSSAAPQAEQSKQTETKSANSNGSATSNPQGSANSGSQASSGSSVMPYTGSDDHDGDRDADDAPITDATWKDIQNTGQRTEVFGTYVLQGSGGTHNLVGDFDALMVQGSDVRISVDDVDSVTVQGSNVTIYARDIDHLTIQGSNVTVYWLGDDPTLLDTGAGNTVGRLIQ